MTPEAKLRQAMLAAAQQPLLTVSDLARHYDVTERTIWRWLRAGRLPAPVRLKSGPRWSPFDIVRFDLTSDKSDKSDR